MASLPPPLSPPAAPEVQRRPSRLAIVGGCLTMAAGLTICTLWLLGETFTPSLLSSLWIGLPAIALGVSGFFMLRGVRAAAIVATAVSAFGAVLCLALTLLAVVFVLFSLGFAVLAAISLCASFVPRRF